MRMREMIVAGAVVGGFVTAGFGQTGQAGKARPFDPAAVRAIDDEELIGKLMGGADLSGETGPGAKMRAITARMQQSAGRLDHRDAGEETQEVQNRIVGDLDVLIALLKKNSSAADTGSGEARPAGAAGEGAGSDGGSPGGPGGNGGGAATSDGGSGSSPRASGATELRELRMEQMNLPPQERGAILNGMKHGVLPEYKEMVRKYYEALAELRKSVR